MRYANGTGEEHDAPAEAPRHGGERTEMAWIKPIELTPSTARAVLTSSPQKEHA